MHTHLFGNPAILLGQDPWLCVTRLLWICPFGERFFILQIEVGSFYQTSKRKARLFFAAQNIFALQVIFGKLTQKVV
jgi:hypothetical protein